MDQVSYLRLLADEEYPVLLLDADYTEGAELRSFLQSLGAVVYLGPQSIGTDQAPLILLHAHNRDVPHIINRLEAARALFPDAPVGFVMGGRDICAPAERPPPFDDARDILTAVGIGLLCVHQPK